ncbi:hypothetical protein IEO21_03928 [Rhodonia placenta]|uniref:Glutaredoxin domain-containing protein n=1 Tax=Rhodonia placenta TaxID=104341 RepID=A0A8H7P503_9APHY|nr:hypothetical protein IEO21_03928 [Postia placenta]
MASSFRRRRVVWSTIIFSALLLFYVSTHDIASLWSLPQSLKDFGFSPSSSHAGQVALAKLKEVTQRKAQASEIHGLLYFVSEYPERRLDEDEGYINVTGLGRVEVNPDDSIDLDVYAPDGNSNWESHMKVLKEEHPLVIFSKTYCPEYHFSFSQRAKSLLHSYELDPPPVVIELNTRSDGPMIQKILARLTGRRTVPNILLQGKSIGGSDDIHALHEEHKLKDTLEAAGLEVSGVWAGLQVHAA